MKWSLWMIILIFLSGCDGLPKKEADTRRKEKDKNALPVFEISEEIHNFGKLSAGEAVVYTFEFKNSGKGTLEIKNVESGCGCLTVEPQEKIVEPGQTGRIKVVFNTSGLYGSQFQAFRVNSTLEGIGMNLAVSAEVMNDNIEIKIN
jgi:hypothetical protein